MIKTSIITMKNLEFSRIYNSYWNSIYGQVICSKFIKDNFGQCPKIINLYIVKNPRGAFKISNEVNEANGILWSYWYNDMYDIILYPLAKKMEKLFIEEHRKINVDVYVEGEWS